MSTVIDRTTWPRRHHLAFFEGFSQPHFQVTSEVDVTPLVRRMRALGHRPFPTLLYAVTRACNEETALRLRLRFGAPDTPAELILHDVVHPSFTARVDLPPESTAAPGCDLPLFGYATAHYTPVFSDFEARVTAASEAVRANPDLGAQAAHDTSDLVFVSSLPWMSYTALVHAMKDPRTDSNPRVTWGRLQTRGDRVVTSVSLQAHHGLADGGHVARWFSRLGALVEDPDWLSS